MNKDVTTISGSVMTENESAVMAKLVYKRFGWNADVATAAWNRLLQNNCDKEDFLALAGKAPRVNFSR